MLEKLKNELYPNYYDQLIPARDESSLLLMRKKGLGKYALYAKPYDSKTPVQSQIAAARKEIRSLSNALWLLNEVGAYIVLFGEDTHKVTLPPNLIDKTGFHAVILQGVNLLSTAGKPNQVQLSQWGSKVFGGASDITGLLSGFSR